MLLKDPEYMQKVSQIEDLLDFDSDEIIMISSDEDDGMVVVNIKKDKGKKQNEKMEKVEKMKNESEGETCKDKEKVEMSEN